MTTSTSKQSQNLPHIVRAALGLPVDRLPVWAMRQAGRYDPAYKTFVQGFSFFQNCEDPERASTITLLPVKRYLSSGISAAIIFSDILVIPRALGFTCEIESGVGPVFPVPLSSKNVKNLSPALTLETAAQKFGFLLSALQKTKANLDSDTGLIGFSGGPFTLFAYMVEGKTSKTWSAAKKWLYKYPKLAHDVLDILTDSIIAYLILQVKDGGADMLQVFESNSGILTPSLFKEFGLPYISKIARGVKSAVGPDVPMTIFCRGAHWAIEDLVLFTDYNVISLDWTMNPGIVRQQVEESFKLLQFVRNTGDMNGKTTNLALDLKYSSRKTLPVLQGNLDPCALYASTNVIRKMTTKMIDSFKPHEYIKSHGSPLFIANLGHGMYPDMTPDGLGEFIKTVSEYKI